MRFYVVGSCRIHGPLRGRPGYQKVLPGYTHTAKEAIQRLRFVRGQDRIPESVAPYVFSRDRTPEVTLAHRKALQDSDVVVVEICSAKEVFWHGYWLNINYAQTRSLPVDATEADALELDIWSLKSMVNRLVVVQHVELPGMEARSRFAEKVRDACGKLGVRVFNPSDYVCEGDMLDVNHYKPAVVRRISDRLMEFLK